MSTATPTTAARLDRIVETHSDDELAPGPDAMFIIDGLTWLLTDERVSSSLITNQTGEIDELVAETLAADPLGIARHHATNFCGDCWHRDGTWYETVYRYHEAVATYTAPTVAALRDAVNADWGWD